MLRNHEVLALNFIRQTIGEGRENPHSLSMNVTTGKAVETITATVFKVTPRWEAVLAGDTEKEKKESDFADKHFDDLLAAFPMLSRAFLVELLQFLGALKRNGLFLDRKDDLFYFHDEEHGVGLWYADDQNSRDVFTALETPTH